MANPLLQNFMTVLGVLIVVGALLALGFALPPRPFRPHPAPSQTGQPRELPADLPEPLRRHLTETAGGAPPEMTTAVIWGRGRARIRGVWLPLRFKLWYRPGQAYTRRIEMTWFQRPLLSGIERFSGGRGLYDMGGREERGVRIDQALALTLWTQLVWLPGALAYPPAGARWEALDKLTARLVFPLGSGSESLLAHFDPANGRLTHLSGQRFAEESEADDEIPAVESAPPVDSMPPALAGAPDADGAQPEGVAYDSASHDGAAGPGMKAPWRLDLLAWKPFQGMQLPCQAAMAWGETGAPRSYWYIEGIAYNVGVDDQLAGNAER